MVLKNLSVWFFVFLATVSEFSFARDIDFDVTQRVVANGTIISVIPNDRARPGDLLVVLDSSDDRSQSSIVLFRDSDGDGRPDRIRFIVPKQIRRSIDMSIVPVNSADSSVYCGVGGQWHGEFEGLKGKNGIRFLGNPTFQTNLACRDNVLGPNLRLENGSVVAGSIQSRDGVTLSTYVCQMASDTVSDECQKKEVAAGLGLVALPVVDVSSACSVLARVIYASDRGRIIASEEEVIRMGGLCLGNDLGIGIESFSKEILPSGRVSAQAKISKSFLKVLSSVWSKSAPVRLLWSSYQSYDIVGWELGRAMAIRDGLPDPGPKPNLTLLQKLIYKVAGK